jgi:flagellar protein FlbD
MIELTRLNGKPIVLNSDLIKVCEASPDTMITLVNGEKLIVREDLKQVMQRVLSYRALLLKAVAEQVGSVGTAAAIDRFATLEVSDRLERAPLTSQDSLSRDH